MQQWILKTPFSGEKWKKPLKKAGFCGPKNEGNKDFAVEYISSSVRHLCRQEARVAHEPRDMLAQILCGLIFSRALALFASFRGRLAFR